MRGFLRRLREYGRRARLWILAIAVGAAGASGETAGGEIPPPDPAIDLNIPFAFFNETFGLAGGWALGRSGYPEPQSQLIGSAMVGTTGSFLITLYGQDLRPTGEGRLFIDPFISFGYFSEADAYINGNPFFPGQPAGTNDSDPDNFVSGSGFDTFARIRLKYLLPVGDGRDTIVPDYEIEDGFLVSGATGGSSLNPATSGRTFFELRPFYRTQEIDGTFVDETVKTNGLTTAFFWDNRDFPLDPSSGNGLTVQLSRDFGMLDSSDSWTVLEAEFDAYVDLGEFGGLRRTVLAFDFWTADTLSWEENAFGVSNRPPAFAGATLGGLWRMRAFPSQRFNDRAAIYYAGEVRMTPHWNPFDNWTWLQQYVGIEWIQFVPFVEVGRVAGEYDLGELHSDMKVNVGLGLRAWAKGFVVRIDTAASEEGFGVQMMIGHPFQF